MADGMDDHLFVRLFDVRKLQIGRSWDTADVCSAYWRLYVNSRDGASLILPQGRYALTAGRTHFVPAWTAFSCRSEREIDHFYVHFDVVGWPGPVVRRVFDGPRSLPAQAAATALRRQTVAALEQRGADDPAVRLRAKALVELELARLIERLTPDRHRQLAPVRLGDSPISQALAWIDAHLAEPLSNQALAERCALSVDHFAKLFRQAVGQTPARYVAEQRILRAAQELLFTAESIERIAERHGFANRFHFSRVFSRRMGVGPATYRRADRV